MAEDVEGAEPIDAQIEGEENFSLEMDDSAFASTQKIDMESVYGIPVNVTILLGKTSMTINEMLRLGPGSVVELERTVGEPVDICVNDRLIARGEIVIVEDKIGITMTEIMRNDK